MVVDRNIKGATDVSRKLRVLIIAEQANPEWTSVPLVGWSLANAIGKIAEVHLVTQVRNKDALMRKGLVEGRDFTALDNEKVASPLHAFSARVGGEGKGWTTVAAFSAISYYVFESLLWRTFRGRLEAREFDVVHRITPLSPTSQSSIAAKLAKIDVPFVLGPLNGGLPWPHGFRHRQHAENEWLSYVRALYKLMPAYRSTRINSGAIISGSRFTQGDMPGYVAKKSIYIPENGIDADLFGNSRDRPAALPLQGGFIGRLVPYKGADILIEAASPFLKDGSLKLHIVGDGPQKQLLLEKVRAMNVSDSVIFHGWIPHSDIQARLRQFDFLALPSIREFGGGVVVEAMALGVMPIVASYGGPAELVDEQTGLRVPFTNEKDLTEGFRAAIASVLQSPELLSKYGGAARQKVLDKLTWDAKAKQILRIYEAVIQRQEDLRYLKFF